MSDEQDEMRSPRNEYPGYILRGTALERRAIRLDFNPQIHSEPEKTTLQHFNMRMFLSREGREPSDEDKFEIAVKMSVEQWQDLIDAMKAELEMARRVRKEFEGL